MKIKTLIGAVFALSLISIVLPQTDLLDAFVTTIGNNTIPAVYSRNIVETTSIE